MATIEDISVPPIEPVDLSYAKTFLRIDHTHEDALIADLIRGARERIEGLARTSLIARPRKYITSQVHQGGMFINHHPIHAITALRVINGQGEAVEIPHESLTLNVRARPVSIKLNVRQCWADYLDGAQTLEVDIEAGYGATPSDIPMPLRQALLLILAQSYEKRDDSDAQALPMMVDALLMPYRSVRL